MRCALGLFGVLGLLACSNATQSAGGNAAGAANASGGSPSGVGGLTPGGGNTGTTGGTSAAGGTHSGGPGTGGTSSPNGGSPGVGPGTGGMSSTGGGSTSLTAGSGGVTAGGGTSAGGDSASGGTGGVAIPVGMGDLGPADYAAGELDGASDGATITFQNVGGTGWYPSRRDPATGPCDVVNTATCCMTQHQLTTDQLTPWNEELSMTIRGPMAVKQIVAYQPGAGDTWARVSAWDSRGTKDGIAFWGSGAMNGFDGRIGNICEAEVAPDMPYPAGPGSVPYCPAGNNLYYGFAGSKLIVVLGWDPHQGSGVLDDVSCGPASNGWNDAPWIGLTHGELVRSGRYSDCQCWSKPGNPYAQDGCGQFNVFEVVNDNNMYANFDLFSTNLVSYAGYIGEGPCGNNCDASGLPATSDLLNKNNGGNTAAAAGAVSGPGMPTGAAFVRPAKGYRYFMILLDEATRTVQIALVHPSKIPASINALLPNFPTTIPRATIDAVVGLRLPN